MDDLIQFLSFSDPNAGIVTLGTMFIGLSAAVVGSFAFLRKRALVGDAIAHAILPGVALAFVLGASFKLLPIPSLAILANRPWVS